MIILSKLSWILFVSLWSFCYGALFSKEGSTCTIQPDSREIIDDAIAIREAFEACKEDSKIVFAKETFNISSVMVTTGLRNVQIEMPGYLQWDDNITYWVNNSVPLGYQNQSCAWVFGGTNITFDGMDTGTFDGNGQVWYDFTNGVSNVPGRPINFVIQNTSDSLFQNLRFVQSQFWTLVVNSTRNTVLRNVEINSTSLDHEPARNTDGVDTFFSNHITFQNFTITNGDDSISLKANLTNILIQDCTFFKGLGVAIGSIGQYPGVFETVENVTAERINCVGTEFAGYFKTWTGVEQGFPPNGGGGGLGFARNITFRDYTVENLTSSPASITQCTSFQGSTGGCDTSLFQISDVTWANMTGSTNGDTIASLQCSGDAPCPGITIEGLDGVVVNGTERVFKCSNVVDPVGFTCSDSAE